MASPVTPSQLPLPQPWLLPASQPGCPVSHHDQAQRSEHPSLQSPQGLGIPAFPSSILSPTELKIPLQAFPQRCPKDPTRNLQPLALRYLSPSMGSLMCKLKEGFEFELTLDAIHCRKRLGQLCGASLKRRGVLSQLWARKALTLWLPPWLSWKWSALQEMLAPHLALPKES